MSLINDALKRVKEAQHQAPPSACLGPQLRPVEPVAVPAHHGLGWLVPMALIVVALLTLLLVWELAGKDKSLLAVRAQNADQEQSAPARESLSTPIRSTENSAPMVAANPATPVSPGTTHSAGAAPSNPGSAAIDTPIANAPVGAPAKAAPATETAASTNSGGVQTPEANGQGGTTNPTVTEAQAPKPAPLKLQGIVFSKRPSAVISGKTLFVGDRVREFRVLAITQDTAILVGAGHTNVLSLSD